MPPTLNLTEGQKFLSKESERVNALIRGKKTVPKIKNFSAREQAEMTLPINKLDDSKAKLRVTSDYKNALEAKRQDITRNKRYLKIYQALDPPGSKIDESTGLIEDDISAYSNTYLPVGAAIVDSGLAKLYNTLFPNPNYFEITSDDFEDQFFVAEVTGHLLKRHREMKFKIKAFKALQDASIFDYGVTATRWLLEDGYQPKRRTFDEEVVFDRVKVRRKRVVAEMFYLPDKVDRSDMMNINFMRFYPDPSAQGGLEDARFCCDDSDVTLEELLMNSQVAKPWGKYKNIDKVIASALETLKPALDKISDADIRQEFINSHRIKKIRYWTRTHIIEMAQDEIIFRANIPDWPLSIWRLSRVPNKFRGMGFLERMERLQIDINASMNSRRDFQNLVANPFAIIDQSLVTDGEPELTSGNVLVSSGGPPKDKIFVHNPGQFSNQEGIVDIRAQIDLTEEQAGVSESDKAQISKGRTTATETRAAQAGSLTRTGTVAQLIEEENLEPTYLNMFFLEQQFLRRSESFKYNGGFGDEFFNVDSSTYMWNSLPQFRAKGTFSLGEDIVNTQQLLAAIPIMQSMPQVKWKWPKIALEVTRRLMPYRSDNWIDDPTAPQENIPPQIENQMIANGQTVRVSPLNDAAEHTASHEAQKRSPDYRLWPEPRKMALDQHIAEHGQGAAQSAQQVNTLGPSQDPGANALRGIGPPATGVSV